MADIAIRALSFAYPCGTAIFKDINLDIDTQGLTVLHGSNGSGKSTLLKLICGLLLPSSGSLNFDGFAPRIKTSQTYKRIFYYPQNPLSTVLGIDPIHDMDIWRLALGDDLDPLALWERACGSDFDPAKPWFRMSAGEARKATQAILPAIMDRYWLLDEPLAGLDKNAVNSFVELLSAKLQSSGGAIIVSHDPSIYHDLQPRVLSIRQQSIFAEDNQ